MTNQHNDETTAIATPEAALSADDAGKGVARKRPNIKFIGRPDYAPGKKKILSDPQPIESYTDTGKTVNLPPADWQIKNRLFYHESANEIARYFPHLYKLIQQK